MKRLATLLLGLSLLVARLAGEGADDLFIQVYNLIQQADSQQELGQLSQARNGFNEALQQLQVLRNNYPNWNERVVTYRLRYVNEKLEALKGKTGAGAPAPLVGTKSTNLENLTNALAPSGEVIAQFDALSTQIRQLSTEKQTLEAKLREALSAQPAPVDPKELQRAAERISTLQETNKVLLAKLEAELDSRKNLVDKVVAEEAQRALNEANRLLMDQRLASNRLEKEKKEIEGNLAKLQSGPLKALQTENTALKQQVGELKTDTERGKQVAELAGKLSRLQTEMDDVKKKNETLLGDRATLERQLEDLRAKSTEEGILRIRKLETDLAVAKGNAEKNAAQAQEIAGTLLKEKQRADSLEGENRNLNQRLTELSRSASENAGTVKTLQAALIAERTERTDAQSRLQALQERLDRLSAAPKDSVPSDKVAEQEAEIATLRTQTEQLRNAVRDGTRHEAELEGALAQERDWRKRLEQQRDELQKRLDTAVNATTTATKVPVKIVTASPALEKRVHELEKERDNLAKQLKALSTQAVDRLAAYRNTRAITPRERSVQFHAERQK